MKVQDVLLRAMAKKINWLAAAEILGVSDRTMRRWRIGMEKFGYTGLADRRKGKASPQRIAVAKVEEVLRLYRDPPHGSASMAPRAVVGHSYEAGAVARSGTLCRSISQNATFRPRRKRHLSEPCPR